MIRQCDPEETAALVALSRLQAAYGDAVTRRDWDDVRSLFEPGAVVHIDTRTAPPIAVEGPDALIDFIDQNIAKFVFFEFIVLNAVVDVEGDEGSGRMYISELRQHRDGEWSQIYGLYEDRYRRRDGVWRIAGRRYSSLARPGESEASFPLPPIDT